VRLPSYSGRPHPSATLCRKYVRPPTAVHPDSRKPNGPVNPCKSHPGRRTNPRHLASGPRSRRRRRQVSRDILLWSPSRRREDCRQTRKESLAQQQVPVQADLQSWSQQRKGIRSFRYDPNTGTLACPNIWVIVDSAETPAPPRSRDVPDDSPFVNPSSPPVAIRPSLSSFPLNGSVSALFNCPNHMVRANHRLRCVLVPKP